ncbi:MAG TPA: hypothetical protein VK886_21145 [Vicinamibacterales bacterium]|nr:hypothetical protein [Vicinamibacterales bacterium]
MRRCTAVLLLVLATSQPSAGASPDDIADARRAYNSAQYDAAVVAARAAAADPKVAPEALVILGRALLERYRSTADGRDLSDARVALLDAGGLPLAPALRAEWLVGSAQTLYFEDQFGAAAALFESLLNEPRLEFVGPGGRERLVDWWATACDRAAQAHDEKSRTKEYGRLGARLEQELERDPTLGAAAYWRVVAARGAGDLDEAWDAAHAAWVRAPLAPDRGAQLRADLERIVLLALIPELARRAARDQDKQAAALRDRWEAFKQRWSIGSR